MKFKGIAKGRIIELEEPLPYAEGQSVSVSVEPVPMKGSAEAILKVMREPPYLSPGDVDALERAIEEGQLPPIDEGIFDEEDSK